MRARPCGRDSRPTVYARARVLESLEPPPALTPAAHTVSTLISAERSLAPPEGRAREREQLLSWCRDQSHSPIRVLDGPSGVGKTRLAMDLVRSLSESWVAGRCVSGKATEVLNAVLPCQEPTLVVIDDADTELDIPGANSASRVPTRREPACEGAFDRARRAGVPGVDATTPGGRAGCELADHDTDRGRRRGGSPAMVCQGGQSLCGRSSLDASGEG